MRLNIKHDLQLSFATPLRVQLVEPPPEPSGSVYVTTELDGGFTMTAKGQHMAYVLPDGKQVGVTISYTDAEGHPTNVDGAVHWESSNPNVVDVFTATDGATSATVRAKDLGTCQVVARADADMGDGVREIITTFDVEVVAGEAVAGTIAPTGEPQDIPVVDHRK
jgi:hypothetical protein